MSNLNSRLARLQQQTDDIADADLTYLLSEAECERFASMLFQGHRGVLIGEYVASMLVDGKPLATIRTELAKGLPVIGHRKPGTGPRFVVLDVLCDPQPPTSEEVEQMITLVKERLGQG